MSTNPTREGQPLADLLDKTLQNERAGLWAPLIKLQRTAAGQIEITAYYYGPDIESVRIVDNDVMRETVVFSLDLEGR